MGLDTAQQAHSLSVGGIWCRCRWDQSSLWRYRYGYKSYKKSVAKDWAEQLGLVQHNQHKVKLGWGP